MFHTTGKKLGIKKKRFFPVLNSGRKLGKLLPKLIMCLFGFKTYFFSGNQRQATHKELFLRLRQWQRILQTMPINVMKMQGCMYISKAEEREVKNKNWTKNHDIKKINIFIERFHN